MMPSRFAVVAAWALSMAAAAWIVVHARYVTDLSAFLPAHPTPQQRLLVDQLRDGPASRTILAAFEGGDDAARADASNQLLLRLRGDARFAAIDNGGPLSRERDQALLLDHRYLLSDRVGPGRFTVAGLREAIGRTVEDLSSSTGLLTKFLVPHDPTGEFLAVLDRLAGGGRGPRVDEGVWASADGSRALLVLQTAAPGSDTDAQESALNAVRAAARFADPAAQATDAAARAPNVAAGAPDPARHAPGAAAHATDLAAHAADAAALPAGAAVPSLRLSGPGVFAVAARAKIKGAAVRLSLISSALVIALLLAAYRSVPALLLGLLPVATGALAGVAAVALGFGVVHGITLGFGVTLIGESVDYSIYFFIQSQRFTGGDPRAMVPSPTVGTPRAGDPPWQRLIWPTLRLGMLTSVCGFASLLPSGFPGLAQLGLYSITGLVAAALVTRWLLPVLVPRRLALHDMAPLGRRLARTLDAVVRNRRRVLPRIASALAGVALLVLILHRHTLWNRELAALSPVDPADQAYDARLRADLGAADVLDLVVVKAGDRESALRGAERAAAALQPLIDANVIGGIDSPTNYLPSEATQAARRASLPDPALLQSNLRAALSGSDLDVDRLDPFLRDVEAARTGPLLEADDLRGTSLAGGLDALLISAGGGWSALLPLHAPLPVSARMPASASVPPAPASVPGPLDLGRVKAALLAAGVTDAQVLDLKRESDALYSRYLDEATRLSLAGFVIIVVLLLFSLRSATRTLRVLAPLVLAVLGVAATLVLCGQRLTILHLVGMLLIVAVGSNYALFFDREAAHPGPDHGPLTLASLAVANLSTVIAFGLLSFSRVPVLVDLGETVAPGALLALLFSALLIRPPSSCAV